MKDVFRGSYSEAMNVSNLLENREIQAFVANQYMASIEPWVVSSGGNNPVVLKVSDEDYDKAIQVVKEYIEGAFSL